MNTNFDKVIILIYGPMCSGKSTLISLLKKRKSGLFHASMDNIKWFISDYSTDKYASSGIVNDIMYSMCKSAVKAGLSVIVEGCVGLILNTKHYDDLAKEFKYRIIKLNVEADYNTLLNRFKYRLRRADGRKYKTSTTSISVFYKKYIEYLDRKNKNIPTVNTSRMKKTITLNKIIKIIKFR